MQKRTIRFLFLATLLILPLQYGLVGLLGPSHGEPWPAIVLPGFKRVLARNDEIVVPHATFEVHFRDGTHTLVSVAEMLALLPPSHRSAFMHTHLAPDGTVLQQQAAQTWVRQRVAELYPDRPAVRCDVLWSELVHQPRVRDLLFEEHPVDTLTLPLP